MIYYMINVSNIIGLNIKFNGRLKVMKSGNLNCINENLFNIGKVTSVGGLHVPPFTSQILSCGQQ